MSRTDSIYGQTICGAVSLRGEVHPEVVRDMLASFLPEGRSTTLHSHSPVSNVSPPRHHWAVAATCEPIATQGAQVWFDGDWELNQFLSTASSDLRPPISAFWRSLPGGWCGLRVCPDDVVELACDRIGLRDLYYTQHENVLYFSNVIRSFYRIPGWSTGTDASRVCEYMAYRRIAGRHTMYRNVDRVLPGEVVRISFQGKQKHDRFWAYGWYDQAPATSQELLHKKLQQQLQSIRDDPALDTVLLLSGGVDSAGLLAESCRVGYSLPSWSLTPDDVSFSEQQAIHAIHAHLGTQGDFLEVGASTLLQNLEESHIVLEQPVVHTIALLHMELYRSAHVCGRNAFVCGEAADTLFGYDRFARYHQLWRCSNPVLNHLARIVANATQNSKALLWSHLTSDHWMEFVCRSRAYFGDTMLQEIVCDWHDPHQERLRILREAMSAIEDRNVGNAASMADMRVEACSRYYFETFIQDCRIFVALGRAAGMEPILPYAASSIRDLALSLPAARKFRHGCGKYHLKKAMEACLPSDIVWGRKKSGEQPLGRWMREDAMFRELLDNLCRNRSPVAEYLQIDSIRLYLREHMAQTHDWSGLLWQVLSLHVWLLGVENGLDGDETPRHYGH